MTAWLRWSRRDARAAMTLFCFHHAGSGASSFQPWVSLVPAAVNLAFVQLPGRENRSAEPPFHRMAPLIGALADAVQDALVPPFAFYGHSMGARVSFALAHHLAEHGLPEPETLFLSGTPGPPVRDWRHAHHLPDDDLVRHLDELGGVSDVVRQQPGLLRRLLPCIRADLQVSETCSIDYADRLTAPVHAFAGADDQLATPAMVRAWDGVTTGDFRFHIFPGGHFFTLTSARDVVDTVLAVLDTTLDTKPAQSYRVGSGAGGVNEH